MHIQWFPGHMTKAMRMMEQSIKQVDCIIYVLDCRAVRSSLNPTFDKMIGTKPTLYVLNKRDLVEERLVKEWLEVFKKDGKQAIAVSSVGGKERNQIIDKIKVLNNEVIQKFAQKGANKIVRAMVVGVPNTGKSTLINSICRSKKTITGNRPGVTRGKQWVGIAEGIELLDTPGSLPPAFEDQERAKYLAFVGSIKEDILHIDELALEMIEFCRERNITAFCERYKMDEFLSDNIEIFDQVAKVRGVVKTRSGYDYDRVAKIIVDDFKKGKFGKIMLDLPFIDYETKA